MSGGVPAVPEPTGHPAGAAPAGAGPKRHASFAPVLQAVAKAAAPRPRKPRHMHTALPAGAPLAAQSPQAPPAPVPPRAPEGGAGHKVAAAPVPSATGTRGRADAHPRAAQGQPVATAILRADGAPATPPALAAGPRVRAPQAQPAPVFPARGAPLRPVPAGRVTASGPSRSAPSVTGHTDASLAAPGAALTQALQAVPEPGARATASAPVTPRAPASVGAASRAPATASALPAIQTGAVPASGTAKPRGVRPGSRRVAAPQRAQNQGRDGAPSVALPAATRGAAPEGPTTAARPDGAAAAPQLEGRTATPPVPAQSLAVSVDHPQLGPVHVRVQLQGARVAAAFGVGTDEARVALASHTASLEQALEQQGLRLGGMQVGTGGGRDAGAGGQGRSGPAGPPVGGQALPLGTRARASPPPTRGRLDLAL